MLIPCLPAGGGLNKSNERSEVWIELLNFENKRRVENLISMGLQEIEESFARGEK
jgi:hypothetical protein